MHARRVEDVFTVTNIDSLHELEISAVMQHVIPGPTRCPQFRPPLRTRTLSSPALLGSRTETSPTPQQQ